MHTESAHTQTNTHMYTHTHTHTHRGTCIHTHTHTHTHTQTHTHAHIHIHTHTEAYTFTYTHTHTCCNPLLRKLLSEDVLSLSSVADILQYFIKWVNMTRFRVEMIDVVCVNLCACVCVCVCVCVYLLCSMHAKESTHIMFSTCISIRSQAILQHHVVCDVFLVLFHSHKSMHVGISLLHSKSIVGLSNALFSVVVVVLTIIVISTQAEKLPDWVEGELGESVASSLFHRSEGMGNPAATSTWVSNASSSRGVRQRFNAVFYSPSKHRQAQFV